MSRLRTLTAGESHGPALVATVEGLPAGLTVSSPMLAAELARRRLGHGRSPRMSFEVDDLEVLAGVRHGRSLGSPISVVIRNTEWPKWVDAMDPEPREDLEEIRATDRRTKGRAQRPRPGARRYQLAASCASLGSSRHPLIANVSSTMAPIVGS